MTEESHRHLSPELMQAFLDGQTSREDSARVREHTSACARCGSELEAWQTLFSELSELTEVAPAAGFADRVLGALPEREPARVPLAARVKGWLGRESPAASGAGHLPPGRIQDLLEGALARDAEREVESHLHACRRCQGEVQTWRGFLQELDGLPVLAPSEAFADKVMAHVRVRLAVETARPTIRERIQLLLQRITPETRKRAAALAGAAVTPAVTLGLVAYTVFSHPLVTLGNLFSFVWLKGSDLLAGASAGLVGQLTESATAFQTSPVVGALTGSPAAIALAATGFFALTLVALWVVYRNVLTAQSMDRTYAR